MGSLSRAGRLEDIIGKAKVLGATTPVLPEDGSGRSLERERERKRERCTPITSANQEAEGKGSEFEASPDKTRETLASKTNSKQKG
jgi:hypothetical protein